MGPEHRIWNSPRESHSTPQISWGQWERLKPLHRLFTIPKPLPRPRKFLKCHSLFRVWALHPHLTEKLRPLILFRQSIILPASSSVGWHHCGLSSSSALSRQWNLPGPGSWQVPCERPSRASVPGHLPKTQHRQASETVLSQVGGTHAEGPS